MSTASEAIRKSMKTQVSDLAIFGGTPAFATPFHVGRPNIGNKEKFIERVNDILDRRWLTNDGRYVREFEERIAKLAGVKHCIAMCNATIALEIAIRALDMHGEVIIPSFTFVATAHALQWQEITPVFCDIDPRTHTLDPNKIEALITPRTTGIIGVHTFGRPCAIEALTEIANRRGLKLLFDSAHALGCSYRGQMIGGFGHAEVFSFHATKFLNSLEGGAVVTNDDDLAKKIALMKNFGFTDYDRTDFIGTNGKMNEVSAAMGLTNLECMNDFISTNRRNFMHYCHELSGIDGLQILFYDESEKCNFQYIVVEIDQGKALVSRDDILQVLHAENVLARRYFYPGCHRMAPYTTLFPDAGLTLPETDRLTERVLVLPNGTSIDPDEISTVCEIIRTTITSGGLVKNNILRDKSRSSVNQPSPSLSGAHQNQ